MECTTQSCSHTLYINNLNEKLPIKELLTALHAVFSSFGKILEIVAAKTYKLRGQAWVIFDMASDAQRALSSLQSFPFYDKPLNLRFSRTASDVIRKRTGNFTERAASTRLMRKAVSQEREQANRKSMVTKDHASLAFADNCNSKGIHGGAMSKVLSVQGLPGKVKRFFICLIIIISM
jgi:U2 small nuclear ribonucleoprotein B''